MKKSDSSGSRMGWGIGRPAVRNNLIVQLVCTRGEGKPWKKSGGETASAERHCTKLKVVCKQLIINEILVEATGVELIEVLTARKLLIPGSATRAKKASLPDPLYVYCTKMLFALEFQQTPHGGHCIRFSGMDRKTPGFPRCRKSPPLHFFGTPACRLDYFRFARHSGPVCI